VFLPFYKFCVTFFLCVFVVVVLYFFLVVGCEFDYQDHCSLLHGETYLRNDLQCVVRDVKW